jgi:predicted O-methyltransferase YrrM
MRFDVAVVNRNTDFFLYALLVSIRDVLPPESIQSVHVWDNASSDATPALLEALAPDLSWLEIHRSATNLYHGPALDCLLRNHCRAEWVLILDSDTRIKHDFLPCLPAMEPNPPAFVGQIHPQMPQLYAYLAHLLVNRTWYLGLPAFRHHGAPGIDFFQAIQDQQIPYHRFRWCDYVEHFGQGTLRQVYQRRETANDFYDFAVRESTTVEDPAARDRREEDLRQALARFFESRRSHSPRPEQRPSEPAPHPDPRDSGRRDRPSLRSRPRRRATGREMLSALADPRLAATLATARRTGLVQKPDEIRRLVRLVRTLRPRRVLEIGTAHGGTFYLWTRVAAPDARLISVDLPPWERDDPGEGETVRRLRSFTRKAQQLHLLRSDSHDRETERAVEALLGDDRLDVLFIDGDHSYDGVRSDFSAYSRLVGPGGLVAFHDIHPHSKGWGGEVPRFWNEIKDAYRSTEFIADRSQDGFGIGVLWL